MEESWREIEVEAARVREDELADGLGGRSPKDLSVSRSGQSMAEVEIMEST